MVAPEQTRPAQPGKAEAWEARFLADLYRLALLLWLAMTALGWLGGWRLSLSLALGGGLSLGLLRFQEWLVRAAFPPEGRPASARRPRRVRARLLVAWFLKFPALAAFLWVILGKGWVAPLPFAIAIALVPLAATGKALLAVSRQDLVTGQGAQQP